MAVAIFSLDCVIAAVHGSWTRVPNGVYPTMLLIALTYSDPSATRQPLRDRRLTLTVCGGLTVSYDKIILLYDSMACEV